MKTIGTHTPADQHVEDDRACVASQTGSPTPNLEEDPGNTIGTPSYPQEIEDYVPDFSKEDDHLGPDDAPEIMSEDDGEVRSLISISGTTLLSFLVTFSMSRTPCWHWDTQKQPRRQVH